VDDGDHRLGAERRADHDVSELAGTGRRVAPIDREGQDVGGDVAPAMVPIEAADLERRHEADGEVAVVYRRALERRARCTAIGGVGGTVDLDLDRRDVTCALRLLARLAQRRRLRLRVAVIGGDDPLDQRVANDVLVAEANELDPFDAAQDVTDDDQT